MTSGRVRPPRIPRAIACESTSAAVDFGDRHIGIAIADEWGNVVDELTVATDLSVRAGQAIDQASFLLASMCERNGVNLALREIVAAVPGPVDPASGRVIGNVSRSTWADLPVAAELERRLGAPTWAENRVALGAYGEVQYGAGRGHRTVVYVKASSGVDAGIVLDGVPYLGATGFAGGIGHTKIGGRSELCHCGSRGCLEAVASTHSIIKQLGRSRSHAVLTRLSPADLRDPAAKHILNKTGESLGEGLAGFCNLFDPTLLIIGGVLGTLGAPIIEGVRTSIAQRTRTTRAPQVVTAELGRRANLLGALHLAGSTLLSERL